MLLSRCHIAPVTSKKRCAAHTAILLCHSCHIFRRHIAKSAADKVIVTHLTSHFGKYRLKAEQANTSPAGQIEQVVCDLKISSFLPCIPMDRRITVYLRKDAVPDKQIVYAERHQPDAAYMVRIRSLHIFVVPDVVKNASF